MLRTILLNKWSVRVMALIVLLLMGWFLRIPLLKGLGGFLIHDDPLSHADAIYVLGGSPVERGEEGARLVLAGYATRAVFTGEPRNELLEAFGIDSSEAGLGMHIAEQHGLTAERVEGLHQGTSTAEEAQAVRAHAERIGADTIIVVTTEFHTRRVSRVFRRAFRGTGTVVLVRAARSNRYDADRWWDSEEGLIMVNNEYMKLLYYAFKH